MEVDLGEGSGGTLRALGGRGALRDVGGVLVAVLVAVRAFPSRLRG